MQVIVMNTDFVPVTRSANSIFSGRSFIYISCCLQS